jgi:hypothetical protein
MTTSEKGNWRAALEGWVQQAGAKLGAGAKISRDVLYGYTVHGLDMELRKERGALEHLFMLVVFGDIIGLPLLPPYYSMRLLPYIVPAIRLWKRSVLREKDLTDLASVDI